MENYPFDTCSLAADVIDNYNDTYKAIKAKFHLEFTGNIDFQLEQFQVFNGSDDINIKGSFVLKQSNNNECYMLFVQSSRPHNARHGVVSGLSFQTWGLAYLKKDFGRALIRRETLTDKIIELVHPVELDFDEDKAFSDTFYVLVNDRTKAISAIDRNFRNAVMDIRHEDFVIEINEHTLIIGDQNPVSPERAVHLAEFVSRVSSMC